MIGFILYFLVLFSPLVNLSFIWEVKNKSNLEKIVLGLIMIIVLSVLIFLIKIIVSVLYGDWGPSA